LIFSVESLHGFFHIEGPNLSDFLYEIFLGVFRCDKIVFRLNGVNYKFHSLDTFHLSNFHETWYEPYDELRKANLIGIKGVAKTALFVSDDGDVIGLQLLENAAGVFYPVIGTEGYEVEGPGLEYEYVLPGILSPFVKDCVATFFDNLYSIEKEADLPLLKNQDIVRNRFETIVKIDPRFSGVTIDQLINTIYDKWEKPLMTEWKEREQRKKEWELN
jgi:hypothetical protein